MPLTDREFEKLLLSAQPALKEYTRKLTRHKERAEDLQQDANVRAWTKRHLYVEGNFTSWLKTVARHFFLNQVKKEALLPIKTFARPHDNEVTSGDVEEFYASGHKSTVSNLITQPNQEDLWLENKILETIASLPPHQALLVTKKLEGLTYTQIATPLGIKPNNAKQRYFNVVKELRELLLQQGLLED